MKASGKPIAPMANAPSGCADERVVRLSDRTSPYDDNATTIYRLNQRHKLIIDPFLPQIEGARVLDIAAHDGRWSYALAAAGASGSWGSRPGPSWWRGSMLSRTRSSHRACG